MTAKRFTLNSVMNFDYGILDNGKSIGSLANICDLLNALHEENQQIKTTIKEAYENERTMIGKSVLKQLMEQIQ